MTHRARTTFAAAAAFATVVALAPAASATPTTTTPGVLQACVNNSTGLMRLISGSARCQRNETLITWNAQGPTGPAGPAGSPGAPGAPGIDGLPGTPGPSNGYFWNSASAQSLTNGLTIVTQGPMTSEGLPAGNYIVTGTAQLNNTTADTTTTECYLSAFSNTSSSAAVTLAPGARGSVSVTWAYTTANPGAHVSLTCTGVGGVQATSAQITAVRVGSLN